MLDEMFETLKQINEQVDGAVKVINEQKKLLAEYEKENAELKQQIEQWKQEWQDAQIKANEEGFTRTQLQIKYKDLEKENAELKKQTLL